MNNSIRRRVLPLKHLAFDQLTTPDKESGLSCLQSACIKGDIETVGAILNHSPDKLDSAIALSLKIGHNAANFAGKSIYVALREQVSKEHKQISELVEKVTKHLQSPSLLHLAAKKGQVEHLRRLLDCGEHVDAVSPDLSGNEETPLMLAARFNEEDVVEFLAERNASLEMQDYEGYTALHHAAMAGKVRNILRLIELGADASKEWNYGQTALYLAVENGHKEAVRLLIEHGKKDKYNGLSLLMLAALKGHLQIIHFLLKNGESLSTGDEFGRLPLHFAAHGDQTDVVKFVLDNTGNIPGNISTRTSSEETLLHFATRLDLVQYLVEQGADIHARDCSGRTPLHVAVMKGQTDTVSYLLDRGADINSRDMDGHSALYFAVHGGHAAACKVLIERECDLNLVERDDHEFSYDFDLFKVSAEQGLTDVLQLLLDRGFSEAVNAVDTYGETPLSRAAIAGHYDTVAFLLDRGANINGSDATEAKSPKESCCDHESDCDCEYSEQDEHENTRFRNETEGISPLYRALQACRSKVARLLIERGADTSNTFLAELAALHCTRDVIQLLSDKDLADGETLLTSAAYSKDFDSIPLLLEKGVDVNERNKSGDTALSCVLKLAPRSRAMEMVKLLVSYGADVNIKKARFQTPLEIACSRNLDNVAELLLELGCELNVKDSCSSLCSATRLNNGKLVKVLLQYGANANIKCNEKEMTPLHIAVTSNCFLAAQVLLEHGVQLEVVNAVGRTPLAEAVVRGVLPMAQLLLKHGSSVNTKDKLKKTPLMLAVERWWFDDREADEIILIKTLLDHGSIVHVADKYGRSPIHSFVENRVSIECCELLAQHGADINSADVNKETPLHFAVARGTTDCVEWLLQQGANVEALDRESRTPLHAAAYEGHLDAVELLIEHGANVRAADKMGWLPLHFAAAGGRLSARFVAEALLQSGSDLGTVNNKGRTALHLAIRSGCRDLIEFLVRNGSDVNAKDISGRTFLGEVDKCIDIWNSGWDPDEQHVLYIYLNSGGDKYVVNPVTGRTALHVAAVSQSVTLLDNLLYHGLELEARDKNGETPLHRAAARGTPEMIQRLLDRGADLSSVNRRGQTPFLVSLATNKEKNAKILLEHGSNMHVADKDRNTALHFAKCLPIASLKLIIKEGGDVNAVNVDGCSPLHRAVFHACSRDAVRLLLKAGANVHCRDKQGNTPLHIAASKGRDEIASLLIEYRSDVHATNEQGRTCLHVASTIGMVQKLIRLGVQVSSVDELGSTPLHLAVYANNSYLAKVLLKNGRNLEAVDYKGSSPLHVGCCSGSKEAVSAVIDQGSNIEARDIKGCTPLHICAVFDQRPAARLLLKREADLDARDNEGSTPLHLASAFSDVHMVRLFLQHGASVKSRDSEGGIALHTAAALGKTEVVRVLVDAGSHVNALDGNGNTPLHVSAGSGHMKVVRLLLDDGADVQAVNQEGLTPAGCAKLFGNKEVEMCIEERSCLNA